MRRWAMLATVAAVLVTLSAGLMSCRHDPCRGHVTRDGITATEMGSCDEMPGVN